MTDSPAFTLTPKITHKDAFIIVGFEGYTGNGFYVIRKAWDDFMYRCNEIKNIAENDVFYGYEDYSRDFTTEPMRFYYMAGIAVSSADEIPEGMTVKNIPASDYAVFTVKGCNANGEIGKAFRYIYDTWLPTNAEYDYSSELCGDFEYYDKRWDVNSPDCEVDLYVPLTKKQL